MQEREQIFGRAIFAGKKNGKSSSSSSRPRRTYAVRGEPPDNAREIGAVIDITGR